MLAALVSLVLLGLSIQVRAKVYAPPIRDECTGVQCPTPRCVDGVKDGCCVTCPEGDNCWLGMDIVSVGQDVIRDSGDPGCPIVCRCPSAYKYQIHGSETPASCSYTCNGIQIDTQPGDAAPGLGRRSENPFLGSAKRFAGGFARIDSQDDGDKRRGLRDGAPRIDGRRGLTSNAIPPNQRHVVSTKDKRREMTAFSARFPE